MRIDQQTARRCRPIQFAAGAALLALSALPAAHAQTAQPVLAVEKSPQFTVATPRIPIRTFRVADFGATGDGKTKDTAALQRAIDACGAAGGGTVIVPAGRYLTGPLHLVSNLELRLEKNAVLLLSDNPADFKLTNNRYEDAFTAKDGHDIALTGSGIIDGQGEGWWLRFAKKEAAAAHRPYLITFTACRRVLVQGITLTNSPMFHLVPQRCQDVTVDSVHILAPESAPNTDGIDPSGWRIHIQNCVIDTGDDDIAVKPDGRIEPGQPSCKDILVENCIFLHGHGMSVGGQTPGGLNGMTVRNCTFKDTATGIRLKASRGQGGLVQNLTYENLTLVNVRMALQITSFYNPSSNKADPDYDTAQPITPGTPIWRHIAIRNVTATDSATDGQILGLAEMPIDGLVLTNVHLSGHKGLEVRNARDIQFDKSNMAATAGPPLSISNSRVVGTGTPF